MFRHLVLLLGFTARKCSNSSVEARDTFRRDRNCVDRAVEACRRTAAHSMTGLGGRFIWRRRDFRANIEA
jgi:hypothetical protein